GSTSGTFTATTFAQVTDTAVDISASLNGLTRTGTLLVGSPPGNATFDAALRAPRCATPGSVCDTGGTLIRGRDNITNGIEPNQPNTLQGSCADGTVGTFHSDESIDRLRISTVDGFTFAPGKVVNVEAGVWVFNSPDGLDIFSAPE